jgi:hypothetical protein
MRAELKLIILIGVLCAGLGYGQSSSDDYKQKIDAIVSAAYKSASVKFPCALKTQGDAQMLSWQAIDKCLNYANDQIDWEELARQVQEIRKGLRYQDPELNLAIESSLSAQAIPYNKVFRVKDADALLPLSSSLLKFLPPDSLLDLPVYDNSGVQIGTFSGTYVFEKVGELSGKSLKHTLFQYTTPAGVMRNPSNPLLLDSYGVRWKQAQSHRGFRLSSDMLLRK